MSDDRCRACGAALPEEAAWCTLCFTEVRQPEAVELTVPEPEPVQVPVTVPPTAEAEAATEPDLAAAMPAAKPARHRAEATWPCPQCEARVPMSLDACEECGARFLAGASSSVSTRLPVVGDVGEMSNAQRLLVAVGIACVLVVLFVFLFFIGGHIF